MSSYHICSVIVGIDLKKGFDIVIIFIPLHGEIGTKSVRAVFNTFSLGVFFCYLFFFFFFFFFCLDPI